MQRDLRDSALYEDLYRFKERRSNVRFFAVLFLLICLIFGFRIYWVRNFGGVQVDGPSMNMTLHHGEQLLIRYVENGEGLKRGDVIIVHVENYETIKQLNANRPEDKKLKYLIKRLIAVEGDVVKCIKGQVYIKYGGEGDFIPLEEPYAHYTNKNGYNFAEYTVKKGQIFFLGDNRNNSVDSRYKENAADGTFMGSHLNQLYLATDVFGVVPQWAIDNQSILEKIFF